MAPSIHAEAAARGEAEPRARIAASALFDAAFYRKTYGHLLGTGEDPLDHFLRAGLAEGHLPSAGFDPVLYRVLVPECGDANPLLHCLQSGKPFAPPPFAEVFPEVVARITVKEARDFSQLEVETLHAQARGAAAAREIPFEAAGRRYVMQVPEAREWLGRLEADRPFACARLPHGFWDSLWILHAAEQALAGDSRARHLGERERHALALRLCAAVRRGSGNYTPCFIEEVLRAIPEHKQHPDYYRAVAFKGHLLFDQEMKGYETFPPRDEVMSLFARHYDPAERIYDATLWKRMLFAGPLGRLPALCRGRPVVLVANRNFARLGARWRLPDYTHVEIPPRNTQQQRYELLDRVAAALSAAAGPGKRPPALVSQCGGSVAYWLISRLFRDFPGVFYIDLGESLNAWFMDVLDLERFPWIRIYGRPIIANCGLEEFYRSRKRGPAYEEWLRNFA